MNAHEPTQHTLETTMKRTTTWMMAGALALALGAGCSESGFGGADDESGAIGAGGGTAPVGSGVGQSGAQDFGRFRDLVDRGELPSADTLDGVGFFNEHKIELPPPECGNDVCLHGALGVQGNMISGNNCTMLLVGFNTELVASDFERPPLNMSIAVDVSGSMSGEPISAVRAGLAALVDTIDPKDTVTLIAYSGEAETLVESTPDSDPERQLLRDAVNSLEASGGTNIYEGLRQALESTESRLDTNRQNRVILLSDGVATAGIESNERIINLGRTYAERGIGITTIGVGSEFDLELMRSLSEAGSGNFYFMEDVDAVEEVFSEEVNTFLVPLAEDVEITFDVDEAYDFRTAHGTRMWSGTSEQAKINVPALFIASRQSIDDIGPGGGRRGGGGMILLELTPTTEQAIIDATPPGSEAGVLSMRYRIPGTEQYVDQSVSITNSLRPGDTPQNGEFENFAVEKAFVALNVYVGFKMALQRAEQGAPGSALAVLDPLYTNVQQWEGENPDEDIASDLDTMEKLINIIETEAQQSDNIGRPPSPPDPWPND
jgi:Ca-activated chloride channel family protein